MKLVTYNMRKAIGLDRRRDPHRVMDVINQTGADVVVLQEADRRLGPRPAALARRLIEDESDFVPVDLAANGVSLGSHGNAILVRKGLSIAAPTRIELPGFEPRGAVSVEVAGRLRVVGVHLGLMRRHRMRQLATLSETLDGHPMPTAILGDFNEWSASQGFEALHDDYTLHSPGHSYHAARPMAALDRVALSHGLTLRDAGVVETKRAKIASDHLPVWADVALTGG
ncbi:endonuclease/exonuclease/phosphatase family protein [Aliiroseovarius subalbicans]|uniref:endonuclease/exonuclease/phosphatase family protein n=1 Tax=Aliiroseovarius subalbicans TaxID=2925840 RepID=UPI001F56FEAD|nr:endonuclease/exonuclease/phosphatase family protein [Aliiroseovarius subalbicans]MCI2398763.1 endonuclease/exonuclease/phosphatase family protein [Aliiroseovarius subalbicans]